jgi:hypothetical protein
MTHQSIPDEYTPNLSYEKQSFLQEDEKYGWTVKQPDHLEG